jgi:hypothetical protein
MIPKAPVISPKTDKLNYIRMKNVCVSKDTISRVERQTTY